MSISASGQQHVEMYRKVLLRRRLLRWADPGAVYVPFIGDGDLAVNLYRNRQVFGADLDPDRVATAASRLSGDIRVADCDGWPFPGCHDIFAIADFDAYSEPYLSFRSWWKCADRADKLVLFFTDGHKQGLMRTGHWHLPDGSKQYLDTAAERRPIYNFYLTKHVWPWFEDFVRPYRVTQIMRYQRAMMTYWGAAIRK
jgi:hypothetical protein